MVLSMKEELHVHTIKQFSITKFLDLMLMRFCNKLKRWTEMAVIASLQIE